MTKHKEGAVFTPRRLVVLIATIGITSCLLVATFPCRRVDQVPFNSERWNRDTDRARHWETFSDRQKMMKDLVTNVLPGLKISNIEVQLGHANKALSLSGYVVLYYIGLEHEPFHASNEWEYLIVKFSRSGAFAGWSVDGSADWPIIVGSPGKNKFIEHHKMLNDVADVRALFE